MKVLVIGGHFSPAISVIESLQSHKIYYIGRKYALEGDNAISLEALEMRKRAVPFFNLNTGRLQRKFTTYTIPSLLKLPLGFYESTKILRQIRPDIVLGFGGYVQLPIIMVAKLFKIPSVIHEQTFDAGLSNRAMGRLVSKVCISWETSRKYFPKGKVVLTGLPIRKKLADLKKEKFAKNSLPLLYITGGSLGSHTINKYVQLSLKDLLQKFAIVHQTGDSQVFKDFESLTNIKNNFLKAKSKSYTIKKFLSSNDASYLMRKADIVISRAGINTVAELLYFEKPSFLIPISYSQSNEQVKNAEFLKAQGLAEVYDENHLTPKEFKEKLFNMYSNLSKYEKKKNDFNFETAAQKIVEVLEDVYKKEKH
ncbi:MAG: hypothetical protein A2798_02135 [Candidatus Levybacteria bacterium RIFCSPHIGHO2_01_FULL_37_17]|nr:MAG: hypothetical protein A2798_02135 [Candidatus Levybacteria bacterium RIFCSPHIGHO2_01_FULL_37_17]OGH36678.1 MAG: hypothetical protein A2959_00125 [Candidatus Levybacteria bacterium RIFCSPLOWO2_01_FULL_38_23]